MVFGLTPGIEEMMIAAVITFVMTLVYKFLINQNKLKELKEKMKEKQQKIKELQKENPEEARKVMNEMLKLSNKQFRMSMKPMFVSLIIFLAIVLPILPNLFPDAVVYLPPIPFLTRNILIGSSFGWFGWYLIISIPLNSLFRRILGVNL